MNLQSKLDALRDEFESSAPPEVLAVMHQARNDLQNSGAIDLVLKVGDKVPDFKLPNALGELVGSSELLNKGQLIVSFYRGVW